MTQDTQTANPLLGDEYLTDKQTADFLGVHPRTLYRHYLDPIEMWNTYPMCAFWGVSSNVGCEENPQVPKIISASQKSVLKWRSSSAALLSSKRLFRRQQDIKFCAWDSSIQILVFLSLLRLPSITEWHIAGIKRCRRKTPQGNRENEPQPPPRNALRSGTSA